MLVGWMCAVYGIEYYDDDDRGYPDFVWRSVLERTSEWLLHDLLPALHTGE